MAEATFDSEVTMAGGERTLLAGRYRIVRQLGQGGMGSVWLAEDIKLDNKLFAIKMLPSILIANKRAYRQLKDEALVAMKLVHPNIVTLRAFEETDGNPFLVMDYIEGKTLDECLEEWGKLSEEQTVALLNPIAAAIDYAHSEGVVHRDIKPGNIMIRSDGKPFILDFGIAREVKETLTQVTGKLSSGTLLYMSPEQLTGDMPKPAQDVYSFAAMAYECINGAPPFSRGQVEYQIIHKEPEPLPEGSGITASIMRGLDKTPDTRPKTCTGVLRALQRPQVKKTVLPIKKAEALKTSVKSWGVDWVSLAFIGIVILGFGGRLLYQTYQDKKSADRKIVELQRNELARQEDARKAEAKRQEEVRQAEEKRIKEEQKQLESAAKRQKEDAERKELEKKIAELQAELKRIEQERLFDKWMAEEARKAAVKAEQKRLEEEHKRQKEEANRKNGDTKTITLPGGASMEMIYCAPGEFMMGSYNYDDPSDEDEKGVYGKHKVRITKGFWLGKYEVTQKQWQSVMGDNPSHFIDGDRPVENVSWDDCQEFIQKVNYEIRRQMGGEARLPTEAEWEYACRAGVTMRSLPNGVDLVVLGDNNGRGLDEIAWYGGNSCVDYDHHVGADCSAWPQKEYSGLRAGTHKVGKKKPNNWGFYDMIGNVWEWCNDWYGSDYYKNSPVEDPKGPNSGAIRVLRGGSWSHNAMFCRSASRDGGSSGNRNSLIGFRLCCSVWSAKEN